MDAVHEVFMNQTLVMPRKVSKPARYPVGIFVRDGVIISQSQESDERAQECYSTHVELKAIARILAKIAELSQYPLSSTTLYVMVELYVMYWEVAGVSWGQMRSIIRPPGLQSYLADIYSKEANVIPRFYIAENMNASVPKLKFATCVAQWLKALIIWSSAPSNQMLVSGLPPELLDAIIDKLQGDKKSLLGASLACKGKPACDRLRELITLSPKLALHFRILDIALMNVQDIHAPAVYGTLTVIEFLVNVTDLTLLTGRLVPYKHVLQVQVDRRDLITFEEFALACNT
ncbi:hypothetical protein EDD85DRAFT_963109 [Armillaria nabsnona]|nr:hypothetical protein EDD85DRAFT_963109 [Armillaria nabsnona]